MRDVIEAILAYAIQKGVEEAERGPIFIKQEVIQERDYARRDLSMAVSWVLEDGQHSAKGGEKEVTYRCGAARPLNKFYIPVKNHREVTRLRGDIGEAATRSAARINKVRTGHVTS